MSTPRTSPLLLALCCALPLAACAGGRVLVPRTAAVVSSGRWQPAALPIRRVAVLSSAVLDSLWIDPASAKDEVRDTPTDAVEQALFSAGMEPATRAALRRVLLAAPLAIPLDPAALRSPLWVESVLEDAPTLDGVMVLSGWAVSWDQVPAGRVADRVLCPAVAQLGLELRDGAGRLIWYGRARSRSTDLGEVRGRHTRDGLELSAPDLVCVAAQDCSACGRPVPGAVSAELAYLTANELVHALVARRDTGALP